GPQPPTNSAYAYGYSSESIYITVTVMDGELGDTRQLYAPRTCHEFYDIGSRPAFTHRIEGNTIFLDARDSTYTTGLQWNFGDGTYGTRVITSHTCSEPGEYIINDFVRGVYVRYGSASRTINNEHPPSNENTPP